eukprot:1563652-Alexandrium_andersonii.AAC.1
MAPATWWRTSSGPPTARSASPPGPSATSSPSPRCGFCLPPGRRLRGTRPGQRARAHHTGAAGAGASPRLGRRGSELPGLVLEPPSGVAELPRTRIAELPSLAPENPCARAQSS